MAPGSQLPAPSSQPALTNAGPLTARRTHCVSLEGFDGAVAAESAHVDAHVRAAGGERRVVLPVHVERGGCGRGQTDAGRHEPCVGRGSLGETKSGAERPRAVSSP